MTSRDVYGEMGTDEGSGDGGVDGLPEGVGDGREWHGEGKAEGGAIRVGWDGAVFVMEEGNRGRLDLRVRSAKND